MPSSTKFTVWFDRHRENLLLVLILLAVLGLTIKLAHCTFKITKEAQRTVLPWCKEQCKALRILHPKIQRFSIEEWNGTVYECICNVEESTE